MKFSIQEKIELLATSGNRSTELIATFKDGYADNWFMAVRECFRSQLDIKYTPRIENLPNGAGKREGKLWTQGPRFAFGKGHIFYDTPLGYELWKEAIKQIKLACIVVGGKPNDIIKKKSGNELIEGFVVVEFLIPDIDKAKLIKQGERKMSQNKFVEFLTHGNENNGNYNFC
jgi:hypothetical protein